MNKPTLRETLKTFYILAKSSGVISENGYKVDEEAWVDTVLTAVQAIVPEKK